MKTGDNVSFRMRCEQVAPMGLRPRCGWCGRALRLRVHSVSPDDPAYSPDVDLGPADRMCTLTANYRKVFLGFCGYGKVRGVPAFCTLRCCEAFAAIAYRDGVRIKRRNKLRISGKGE